MDQRELEAMARKAIADARTRDYHKERADATRANGEYLRRLAEEEKQKEEQERADQERKRRLEEKQLEWVERQLAGTSVSGSLECPFQSPWLRLLWRAVIQCGQESNYQRIADWIAENCKQTDLPKRYASNPKTDLGLLLKHDKGNREQIRKDLNKVKAALRKQS